MQREIEVGDDHAFAGANWFADQGSIGCHDRRKATPRDRADAGACVLGDLRLLIGIQPGRRADHEARGLERMLPDVDFRLLRKQVAEDRTRIHRGVDLLAVRDHRVAREGVVVLPARQLTDAANRAVHGAQAGPVALAPDHALVVGRRDLAAPLDQAAVSVEEELGVVEGSAVTFVDADGHHDSRLFAGVADGIGGGRRHRHGLIEQLEVLAAADDLIGGLDERKVRVVGHHGFRKRGELHAFVAQGRGSFARPCRPFPRGCRGPDSAGPPRLSRYSFKSSPPRFEHAAGQ